jgi:hypothetical protein
MRCFTGKSVKGGLVMGGKCGAKFGGNFAACPCAPGSGLRLNADETRG